MIIILAGSAVFALSFICNDLLFRSFELDEHVSLIFIPSGVRVFLAMSYDLLGSISIACGSLLILLIYLREPNLLMALSIALLSGCASFGARWLSVKLLRLNEDLSQISFLDVVWICIIFATISSLSHQLFYYQSGLTQDFVSSCLAMFAGDVLGALLCMLIARYVILFNRPKSY